jgi:hypothetical protein
MLTPRQARFVEEYLVDLSATQAAIRAGYSKKTAGRIGSQNLAKPDIAVAIDAAKSARAERTAIDADWVLARLRAEADADLADLFFDGFAASAMGDGDKERADAFGQSRDALIADAKAAGTDSKEFASALDIVRERQGDTVAGPVSEERLARDFEASMTGLRAEFGERLDGDLAAAQAFIRDLETVSPGVIRSLESTGAGNDSRLIRIAMREARRRGYR